MVTRWRDAGDAGRGLVDPGGNAGGGVCDWCGRSALPISAGRCASEVGRGSAVNNSTSFALRRMQTVCPIVRCGAESRRSWLQRLLCREVCAAVPAAARILCRATGCGRHVEAPGILAIRYLRSRASFGLEPSWLDGVCSPQSAELGRCAVRATGRSRSAEVPGVSGCVRSPHHSVVTSGRLK